MSDEDSPRFEFLLGRGDEMRAEVFVRVSPAAAGAPPRISGTLTGPRRGRDTTLPATARLVPTSTAARAIVTEPAYWTPDLPNLYRLQASVERGDAPPESIDRLVGLRRLGVRGRSLWLDGHRWVPRGVAARGRDLAACKAAAVAAVVTDPDEAVLAEADEIGVAVLALVGESTADDPEALAFRIATWAAHPSAAVAILPATRRGSCGEDGVAAANARKGTLLLAAAVAGSAPSPATVPTGIDALVVALDADETPHASWRTDTAVPLIAWRREASGARIGRERCDALQAALAAWNTIGGRATPPWDWAGYITA